MQVLLSYVLLLQNHYDSVCEFCALRSATNMLLPFSLLLFQSFTSFGFGDTGFHMSFGIGAFPFGLFASTFNFGDGRPPPSGLLSSFRYFLA